MHALARYLPDNCTHPTEVGILSKRAGKLTQLLVLSCYYLHSAASRCWLFGEKENLEKQRSPRLFFFLTCILFAFSFLAGPVSALDELVLDTVLVSVDGKPITLQDLRRRAHPKLVNDVSQLSSDAELRYLLDTLILEKLVQEEAARRRLSVSESETDRYLNQIAAQNNLSLEAFSKALEKEGKSFAIYKEQIQLDILRTKLSSVLMKSSPAISDSEVEAYLESNPKLKNGGTKLKLNQIFIAAEGKSEDKLEEILSNMLRDLEAGKPFKELAQIYSESIEGVSGGGLGVLAEEDLNPAVAEAVLSLQAGEHSQVIRSASGFHVFEVEQRFGSEDEGVEELTTEVREMLEREKSQQWLQEFYTKDIFKLHSVDKKV